jgi:hypothetical protein
MPDQDIEHLKERARYTKYAAIIMIILGVLFIGSLFGDILFVSGLLVALYWYFTQDKIDHQKEIK